MVGSDQIRQWVELAVDMAVGLLGSVLKINTQQPATPHDKD